jgi:hypothetical protein
LFVDFFFPNQNFFLGVCLKFRAVKKVDWKKKIEKFFLLKPLC